MRALDCQLTLEYGAREHTLGSAASMEAAGCALCKVAPPDRHARRLCRRTLRTVYGEAASRVVHSVRLPFYLIVRYVPGANS